MFATRKQIDFAKVKANPYSVKGTGTVANSCHFGIGPYSENGNGSGSLFLRSLIDSLNTIHSKEACASSNYHFFIMCESASADRGLPTLQDTKVLWSVRNQVYLNYYVRKKYC